MTNKPWRKLEDLLNDPEWERKAEELYQKQLEREDEIWKRRNQYRFADQE